ncbi:unnamed protein product [Camellia sinensis]
MNQPPENHVAEVLIQREIEKLDEMNKKQEQRIRNLETKSIQVINLYFVFQGVILLVLSSSSSTSSASVATSSLKCHNWWIPFSLSLLATTLNLFAVFDNMSKILKSREELDQAVADLSIMRLYGMNRDQVSQVLPGTPLNQPRVGASLRRQVSEVVRPKTGSVRRWKRRLRACLFIGLFVGFSGVVMYGCYTIPCH